jgi:hypothetical protein
MWDLRALTWAFILQSVLLIVVLVLVALILFQQNRTDAELRPLTAAGGVRSLDESSAGTSGGSAGGSGELVHLSSYNTARDPFMYDGTYYVLRLKDVRLSTPTPSLKYASVITNGYVSFDKQQTLQYPLHRNGIKVVYHDPATSFLAIPVSYTHEWLNRGLIDIAQNEYVLTKNVFVVGNVRLAEPAPVARTPLALPTKNTIATVLSS